MNSSRLVQMIMRRVLGHLVRRGVSKGLSAVASRSAGAAKKDASPATKGAQGKQARQMAKRARQASKLMRRMGR